MKFQEKHIIKRSMNINVIYWINERKWKISGNFCSVVIDKFLKIWYPRHFISGEYFYNELKKKKKKNTLKRYFSFKFRSSPTLQLKANVLILLVGYMNVSYEKHKHGNLTTTTTSLLLLTTKIFFYKNNILLNVLNLLFVWFEVPKCSYRVYFFLV